MHVHTENATGCECSSHSVQAPGSTESGAIPNVAMRIEGMDCASCVGKIETALARMPGVSGVRLNFATQKLELRLASSSTVRVGDIEKAIKSLGFDVSAEASDNGTTGIGDGDVLTDRDGGRWWQNRRAKQVAWLGVLMCSAYAVSLFFPAYGSWVFASAIIVGVLPFARNALALARSGSPFSIETLMSVATLGALVIGEAEEAAAVVFLFAVGELLESLAAGQARAGIRALTSLVPKTAILLDPHGAQREVAADTLRINDQVLVRPGDRVSADGVIIHGTSSLDESPVTGESIPRAKSIGDKVFAGSINVNGVLQLRVDTAAADNTIARIIHLVEQAQASKAPTARFIERFSRYYTPAVMAMAALIVLVPPLAVGADWETWVYRGLALLLIACPCALVLSTPAAIASGLAAGARRGLLIKGGNALETIGRVTMIAFDKTGTLTEGTPHVTDVAAFASMSEQELLGLAASLEAGSNHPLAQAIVRQAETARAPIPLATHAYATSGAAVHATVKGRVLALGSPTYAARAALISVEQQAHIETLQNEGKTVSLMLDQQTREVLGLVALRDAPRRDARKGVAHLTAMGVRSIMLTGDNHRTAVAISKDLDMEFQAELLPEDKLRLIDEMKRDAKVAMVGDGINDAPALATADVGIAMGGGTDVALETADAALLNSRVTDVAQLVALSRATMANIHQNVAFALGLKGIFLLTTVLGVTGLWVAVLADTGATAIVTLNALRLLRFKGTQVPST